MTVYCVAKNYAAHARELGSTTPGEPIWFLKPAHCIIHDGDTIQLPPGIGRVDHEVELALRIGPGGQLDAYTVAIDVTARDEQAAAKAAGRPWARAKGYRTFLPLGAWRPMAGVDLDDVHLELSVNGALRQTGSTRDMTWSVSELLRDAAAWIDLVAGDIVLTGTPEGVGPIVAGDQLVARAGAAHLTVQVA